LVECSQYYSGDKGCIERQFDLNYHWEVLRDTPPAIGHPGIPGPISIKFEN
jgi:hypothetical protein